MSEPIELVDGRGVVHTFYAPRYAAALVENGEMFPIGEELPPAVVSVLPPEKARELSDQETEVATLDMTMVKLRFMAKQLGVRSVGVKKQVLVDAINEAAT